MVPKTCSKDECGAKHHAREMCKHHYNRWLQATPAEARQAPSLEERFWMKVNKAEGCWEWTGTRREFGHGQFKVNRKHVSAYRFSFEMINGPIPEGLVIDHICHNPPCVNPSHLRAVTHKQNLENQIGPHARSTSGVRGVWKTPKGIWRANVRHHGKNVAAGSFDSLEEAEAAVIAKRNELFTCNDVDRRPKN